MASVFQCLESILSIKGCAIFWRTSKFSLLKEHLIEFNQVAMANAEGSDCMLNRVMTKDNIALAAMLETKEAAWENGIPAEVPGTSSFSKLAFCTFSYHFRRISQCSLPRPISTGTPSSATSN